MRLWRISKYFCTKLTKTALSLMQSILSCRAAARFGSTKASSCIYFFFSFFTSIVFSVLCLSSCCSDKRQLFSNRSNILLSYCHCVHCQKTLAFSKVPKYKGNPKYLYFRMVTGLNPQAQKLELRSLHRIVNSATWKKAPTS